LARARCKWGLGLAKIAILASILGPIYPGKAVRFGLLRKTGPLFSISWWLRSYQKTIFLLFLLPSLSGTPFHFPSTRRLARTPGSE
jgi:hypothetical protein